VTVKELIRPLPGVRQLSLLRQRIGFRGSAHYWERNYARGGTSGSGSYDALAGAKAAFLNAFVGEREIGSVIEFGCGDGNQLSLADYPSYVGLDVSRCAIELCKHRFADDPTKSFFLYDGACFADRASLFTADLAVSLDVIYHLTEDAVFEDYMTHLFAAGVRFVIVYATDRETPGTAPHVRHRHFTRWVKAHGQGWRLAQVTPGPNSGPDRADFFTYERVAPVTVDGQPRAATSADVMEGAEYLPFHRPSIEEEDVVSVSRALRSGWLTHGPVCREFEAEFAAHVGANRAVALSSCTAALHLALVAQDIGPGDEVITTPFTFCASAHVIEHVGATPVFADIDPVTMQIDPAQIERVLGPRTKAIIAVDYGGHPCDIEEIIKMARARGVVVIEDAAHSLGAAIDDRPIGSIADVTAFSFYATKNITTGEGGMLTTADHRLADRVERLRLHGMERDAWRRYQQTPSWHYEVSEAGFKANMTDFQAALGRSQLRREPSMRARRTAISGRYSAAFTALGDLAELPTVKEGMRSAWHLYPLRMAGDARTMRDQITADLNRLGIGTSVHFIPLHLTAHFRKRLGFRGGEFPASEDAFSRVLSLPLYPTMSEPDVERVIGAALSLISRHAR
jgi:dTDP-4-amino-4,6-dideoxygalactose transaminase